MAYLPPPARVAESLALAHGVAPLDAVRQWRQLLFAVRIRFGWHLLIEFALSIVLLLLQDLRCGTPCGTLLCSPPTEGEHHRVFRKDFRWEKVGVPKGVPHSVPHSVPLVFTLWFFVH